MCNVNALLGNGIRAPGNGSDGCCSYYLVNEYKAARQRGSAVEELSAEVQMVKNDMQEIKQILTQLTRVITDGK